MLVDTSALLALLFDERQTPWVSARMNEHAGKLVMSTVNLAEPLIRVRDRQPTVFPTLERRVLDGGIRFVAPSVEQARIAADARGRVPLEPRRLLRLRARRDGARCAPHPGPGLPQDGRRARRSAVNVWCRERRGESNASPGTASPPSRRGASRFLVAGGRYRHCEEGRAADRRSSLPREIAQAASGGLAMTTHLDRVAVAVRSELVRANVPHRALGAHFPVHVLEPRGHARTGPGVDAGAGTSLPAQGL